MAYTIRRPEDLDRRRVLRVEVIGRPFGEYNWVAEGAGRRFLARGWKTQQVSTGAPYLELAQFKGYDLGGWADDREIPVCSETMLTKKTLPFRRYAWKGEMVLVRSAKIPDNVRVVKVLYETSWRRVFHLEPITFQNLGVLRRHAKSLFKNPKKVPLSVLKRRVSEHLSRVEVPQLGRYVLAEVDLGLWCFDPETKTAYSNGSNPGLDAGALAYDAWIKETVEGT